MNDVRDFKCTYQQYEATANGKKTPKLAVVLHTEEFGNMTSKLIDGTNDKNINTKLWESLADELIDEYLFRLNKARS